MAIADELAGLRRGLGRDGQPIPAYQALGLAFRTAEAGAAVVRLPRSPHLTSPDATAHAPTPARRLPWPLLVTMALVLLVRPRGLLGEEGRVQ